MKEIVFMDEQFEKQNIFGLGNENSAYARYFIGKSYLNPLTPAGVSPFFANVTFEPGCRNNWHIHHAASGGGQILSHIFMDTIFREGKILHPYLHSCVL